MSEENNVIRKIKDGLFELKESVSAIMNPNYDGEFIVDDEKKYTENLYSKPPEPQHEAVQEEPEENIDEPETEPEPQGILSRTAEKINEKIKSKLSDAGDLIIPFDENEDEEPERHKLPEIRENIVEKLKSMKTELIPPKDNQEEIEAMERERLEQERARQKAEEIEELRRQNEKNRQELQRIHDEIQQFEEKASQQQHTEEKSLEQMSDNEFMDYLMNNR